MALTSKQYSQVMQQFDQRRLQNREKEHRRLLQVYKDIPEIKTIDEKIASNSVAIGKKMLFSEDKKILEKLKSENFELSMSKIELLAAHNYPANYLDPIYQCSRCKDTGYIGTKQCNCLKQSIVDLAYQQSNIKEVLKRENFQNFSYEYYSPKKNGDTPSAREQIASIVSICQDFIYHFDKIPGKNLLFQGNTGVGKTFLTNCIAKEILDAGHTVLYLTAFQFSETISKHTFDKNFSNGQNDLFSHLFDSELLILDDLGTELNNAFLTSQLFVCINERLLRNKSTIISTNLSLAQLSKAYSERIFSRIVSNYTILKILGEDIRLKKALSQ
ncbi:MAG: ATP-binding protein [Lachnospiraceae bacterium]